MCPGVSWGILGCLGVIRLTHKKVILYIKNLNMIIFYIKIRAGGGALGQQGGFRAAGGA